MSWLRNAVHRAVEATGGGTVTRTVRNYADNVVHQVAGGSKGGQIHRSFKVTLKSLEESAVSCRGLERIELLKRWLILLKKSKNMDEVLVVDSSDEQTPALSPRNNPMVTDIKCHIILYSDSDLGGEPGNFWDVFLHSQALEGLTFSMILEPPNEEEVCLLLEIFGLCLSGGKEVHYAVLSSIQDLGRSFSNFKDEVLIKREEMLQFAQGAIAGLKVSADVARIDVEASTLRAKIDDLVNLITSDVSREAKTDKVTSADLEILKEALAEIRLCSKLEALLLEKKSINIGESSEIHFQKIDKLKVLAESLANCLVRAGKRITDHRHQKEEAIDFRLAKAKEVIESEKELTDELSVLQMQRDCLEAEMKRVDANMAVTATRLKKTREERDKFDEASNEILMRLKTKEDDLLRSVASCKVEADVVQTWINFLEDTWLLQSSYTEQNEKQTNDALEKYGKYIVKLIHHHILTCKEELGSIISQLKSSACDLRDFSERSDMVANAYTSLSKELNSKKFLEEEYLELEAKILSIFTITDELKALHGNKRKDTLREDLDEVPTLFNDIDSIRDQFKSIDRPILDIETIPARPISPVVELLQKTTSHSAWKPFRSKSAKQMTSSYQQLLPDSPLVRLESGFHSKNNSSEDILRWEFDGV